MFGSITVVLKKGTVEIFGSANDKVLKLNNFSFDIVKWTNNANWRCEPR